MMKRGPRTVLAIVWLLAAASPFRGKNAATGPERHCQGGDPSGHAAMHYSISGDAVQASHDAGCDHCPPSHCAQHALCGVSTGLALTQAFESRRSAGSTADRLFQTVLILQSLAQQPPTPPPLILS